MIVKAEDAWKLICRLAAAVGAREAALMSVRSDKFGFEFKTLMHVRPDDSDVKLRRAATAAFQQIMEQCIDQAKDGVIEISATSDESGTQYCLVTLIRGEQEVAGAAAYIVRCRDADEAAASLKQLQCAMAYKR
jgi:hypothetical protein